MRSRHPFVLACRFLVALSIVYDTCLLGVRGTANDAGNYEFLANQTCSPGQTACTIPLGSPISSTVYPYAKHAAGCSFLNTTHILLANPQYSNLLLIDTTSPSPDPVALYSTANGSTDAACDPMGAVTIPSPDTITYTTTVVNGTNVTAPVSSPADPAYAAFVCPARGEVWRVNLATGAMNRIAKMLGTPGGAFDTTGADGLDFRGGYTVPHTTYNPPTGRILSQFSGQAVGTARQPGGDSVAPAGMAMSSDGNVVWISNRNRNLIVAVNVSMTEQDLEGCSGGTCVCPGGGRAGVCDSPDPQLALECCSWRTAVSSSALGFPAGLSTNGRLVAAGSGYASGRVTLLRVVPNTLEGSLTVAGTVVAGGGETPSTSDLSAYATAFAPIGDAVYASNEGRLDVIVPAFHVTTGLLVGSSSATVRGGLGTARAMCTSPTGERLAIVEGAGVRVYGADECNPRYGCAPSAAGAP